MNTQKLILLMILPMLTACGLQVREHKQLTVDAEVMPYVIQFGNQYGTEVDNLIVRFERMGPSEANTLAYCRRSEKVVYTNAGWTRNVYKTPEVVINLNRWNYWPMTSTSDKELMMFHELGHCILNRDHAKTTNSIMYPYHIGGINYTSRYSMYLSELFGRANMVATFPASYYAGATASVLASKVEPELLAEHHEHTNCVHDEGTEEIHLPEGVTIEDWESENGIPPMIEEQPVSQQ